MNRTFRQCAAAMLAAVMTLSAGAVSASAEEEAKKIVVLGDSTVTGAQIVRNADGEFETTYLDKSYADLVAEGLGASMQTFAADAYTIADVIATMDEADVQQALAEADIIIVSVGLHDTMDAFMDTAWGFMDQFGFARFADVFTAQLADYGVGESDLQTYASDLTYAMKSKRAAAAEKMQALGEKLSAYSDAQIVCTNVYNCIDTIENLNDLTANRKMAYSTICNTVSNNLNDSQSGSVNHSLNQMAETYGFDVIDVHAGFKGYAYQYVNLDELDMNPNASGHAWIADAILAVTAELMTGDVDGNGAVDATDASFILQHAADIGAGGSGTLMGTQITAGDVNRDGMVDASDASKVLYYAAVEGTGGTPSWD